MKLRIIAVFLMLSLCFAPMAQAGPHPGPPPPNPHHHHNGHYYYDDEDILIGCGVGLLLGAIVSGSNNAQNSTQAQQQREYEQKVRDITAKAKENAQYETDHAVELIARNGLEVAIDLLTRSWENEGKRTFLEDRNGAKILKVSGFEQNVRIEYAFHQESEKVSVRVTAPDYSVSEENSAYYSEPAPVSSVKQFVGFELSENMRDAAGHLLIQEVAKGTAAAFAGISQGDALIKFDNYDTKDYDVARVNSYINNRARSKSMLKITFSHRGARKTVEIQL